MSKANTIRLFINSLVGCGLVWLWLQLVDLNQVLVALKNLNPWYFFPFLFVGILSTISRSLRLKNILNINRKDTSEKVITIKQLSLLNFTGQLLSFLIPLRAGEVLKSLYLSNQGSMSLSKSVLTILFDRFFDFWSIFMIGAIFSMFVDLPLVSQIGWVMLVIAAASNLPFLVAFLTSSQFSSLNSLAIKLPKPLRIIFQLPIESLGYFYKFRGNLNYLFTVLGLSIFGLLLDCLLWILVLAAFGLSLPFNQLLFANSLSAISFLVPSAPGFVGSAEAFGQLIFGHIIGLDEHLVAAAVVTNHLWIALTLVVTGIISLNWLEIDLKSLWQKIRKN